MANGIDGGSAFGGSTDGTLSPNAQSTIQTDLAALSTLARLSQTDAIQSVPHMEAALLAQLNEAFVQGQPNQSMSEDDIVNALAQQMATGGNGGYSGFGGYGGGDPLEALNHYTNEGLGGDADSDSDSDSDSGVDSANNYRYGGLFGSPEGNGAGGSTGNLGNLGNLLANYGASGSPLANYGTLGNPLENNSGVPYPGNNSSTPTTPQYGQANGGYQLSNSSGEITTSLDSKSNLNLAGDPHETGTVDGQALTQTNLMSSHDDLFDANQDINGGFQIGNTVGGQNGDGQTYTRTFNITDQGYQIQVSQNSSNTSDPTVTVNGQAVQAGTTVGPVTVNQDGSVDITGYNDANGAQVEANITEDSSNQGLNLLLNNFQGINNAGGALIDNAVTQGAGTSSTSKSAASVTPPAV